MPSLWEELHEISAGLLRPALLTHFFENSPLDESEVLETFKRVSAKYNGELMPTLRAYQGGRREQFEHKVLSCPPSPADDLRSWFSSTFQDTPSALILNRVERWSVLVANLAGEISSALAQQDSQSRYDIECVFLIGDYGFTPFGAHVDYGSTRVLHIPLSSVPKSMYLWSAKQFKATTGSSVPYFSPSDIVHTASQYTYEKGDLFFLPPDYYHVGYSPNLTVTLALVLTKFDAPHPLTDLVVSLTSMYGNGWEELKTVRDLRLEQILELAAEHDRLRKLSNMSLSAVLEYEAITKISNFDQEFQIVKPFKIFRETTTRFALYVRGNCITLSSKMLPEHMRDIGDLIEILNTGEILTVNVVRAVFKRLSVDAIIYLIELLIQKHVVKLKA